MSDKPRRNEPCPCGSGRKYKYCHLDADRDRFVSVDPTRHPVGTPPRLNFKDDLSNALAGFTGPLARFCRDNDFHLFVSTMRVDDLEDACRRLDAGTLTTETLLEASRRMASRDLVRKFVEDACGNFDCFAGRDEILLDAVDAHFDEKFNLSVPTLFAQLEGILRHIGGLAYADGFRSTIEDEIWDNRLLFTVEDGARDFNAFVTKLYQGRKREDLNRNAVLHGEDLDYGKEKHSLTLILAILEVRTFLWFERNTRAVV